MPRAANWSGVFLSLAMMASEHSQQRNRMGNSFICFTSLLLSGQREFQRETEVAGGGRITAGRQQGSIGLTVVIECQGEQSAEGIVGSKCELQGGVAATGRRNAGSNVASDGSL